MVNQVTEQLLTPAAQTGRSQKTAQDSSAGFDELLQQKRQTADEPAQTDSVKPVQKKDRPAQAEGKENVKPQSNEDEDIPDDAKAVLAAMMLQPQAKEAAMVVEAPAAGIETSVEALAAEHMPDAEAATAEAAPVVQTPQQAPQAVQTRTAAEAPVETEARPQQEAQQAEVVTAAPETAEIQPQRTDTRGTQQTGAEPVEVEQAPEKAEDERPAEVPLFQQAAEDAVPVKVADPAPVLNQERPLPIESEQAPQQLAEVVMTGVQDGREVSVIRIAPENLGPVQLTLTREADGTLRVALEAANPRTVSLLEKHAQNVQNIMADNLREEVRVEVRENQRPQQQDLTEGQDRQQQQQQRQQEKTEDDSHEFLQRLRLGLIGPEDDEE